MRPLEVIIVNDYAQPNGGSSAVALASARALAKMGLQVTFFTSVGAIDEQIVAAPGIEVVWLDQEEIARDPNRLRAFTRGLYNRSAAAAFDRLLAGKDPEATIIHVHTWTKSVSSAVMHIARRRRFRVVLTLHDFFITCPMGGFFVHKDASLCARKPLSLSCLGCNCDRRNYAQKLWRSGRTFLQNQIGRAHV